MNTILFRLALDIVLLYTLSYISLLPKCNAFSTSSATPQQPPFQHPASPEEAVQNQLHYYQTNQLKEVYNCCSPGNQEATGGIDEFKRQLQIPPYDLICQHDYSAVLLELRPDSGFDKLSIQEEEEEDQILDVALCLVCIRPNRKARRPFPVWYWWEMSLHRDTDSKKEQWLVDCIMPDFDDLDFESKALSIDDFMDDDDEDELTIYWDMNE